MRLVKHMWCQAVTPLVKPLVMLLLVMVTVNVVNVAPAGAQSTTGTIRGRVVDSQGLALPGVTVTAASPNLQGQRTTVTSSNGDYVLTLLPSGPYTVVFEISGFERVERAVSVAPTQDVPLDAQLGVAGVSEQVTVEARSADVLLQTAQVATNVTILAPGINYEPGVRKVLAPVSAGRAFR